MAYFPFQPGQQPMSSSQGVVIASNQSPVSVTGTVTTSPTGNQSVSGTVNLGLGTTTIGSVVLAGGVNPIGSVTALQGTNPWVITGSIQGGGAGTQYLENAITPSVTGTALMFKSNVSSSIVSVVTPSTPLPIVGSISGAITAPPGSIMQTIGSVSGTVNLGLGTTTIGSVVLAGGVNAIGSVAVLQGTNPWQTAIGGSVITVFQDSSIVTINKSSSIIAVVTGSVAAVGSTISYIQNSVAAVIIGGSITATVGTQYLENQIIPSVTGTAVMFKSNISSSIMTVVTPLTPLPVSVQGTVTALQGTTPWLTNQGGSVIAVLQSSSLIGVVTGSVVAITNNNSVIAKLQDSSIIAIPVGSIITVLQSSSLIAINAGSVFTVSLGSIITIQQANSIVGTYAEDAGSASGDKGIFALGVRNDTVASLTSADADYGGMALDAAGRTIIKPFAGENATIISYIGSIVSGSVQLIQASVIGSRSYITDFWLSNTGATTTLVTFQGGDTSLIGQFIAPTGGGMASPGLNIPLKTTLSQDLAFKVSPSSSVLYVTLKGYQAP